jgi:hypothetical protein
MNITIDMISNYEDLSAWRGGKTNPIQTQFKANKAKNKANLTQNKPNLIQNKPNQTQFYGLFLTNSLKFDRMEPNSKQLNPRWKQTKRRRTK